MSSRPFAAPNAAPNATPNAGAASEGGASEGRQRLATNLAGVRARIERALAECGRPAGSVRLMAVTKYATGAGVAALAALGICDFGENYVQAALAKQEDAAIRTMPGAQGDVGGARWHLIGSLQTNKVRAIPGRFASVRTIDRPKLVQALARQVALAGVRLPVHIQVNTTGEATKSGCAPEDTPALARAVCDTGVLELEGLLCIGPTEGTPAHATEAFRALDRAARDLEDALGRPLARSMGMSHDLEPAVAAGSTEVRIGGALFAGIASFQCGERTS